MGLGGQRAPWVAPELSLEDLPGNSHSHAVPPWQPGPGDGRKQRCSALEEGTAMVGGQVSPREAPQGLGRAGSCVEMTQHTWASLPGGLWSPPDPTRRSVALGLGKRKQPEHLLGHPMIPGEIHFALTHPGEASAFYRLPFETSMPKHTR